MTTNLDALRALGDRARRLQTELADVRAQMDPLIADAIRAGTPDLDIMSATGIRSRDTIRAIRDEHGIPPRRRGRRPREQ